MTTPDGVLVVLGPDHESEARRLRSELTARSGAQSGGWIVHAASRVVDLDMPFAEMGRCQLLFEHHIPGRRGVAVSSEEIDAWQHKLLDWTMTAKCGRPKVDFIADSSSGHVTVTFSWEKIIRTEFFRGVAGMLEEAFTTAGGTYESTGSAAVVASASEDRAAATRSVKICTACRNEVPLLQHRCPACGGTGFAALDESAISSVEVGKKQIEAARHNDRGGQLMQQGRFVEAAAAFKAALDANPLNATAHSNLGLALYKQKRVAEAMVWLEKALAIDPRLDGVANALNQWRLEAGDSSTKQNSQKRPWWRFW